MMLAGRQGLDPTQASNVGWALLQEAAETLQSETSPYPKGFASQSCLPEQLRTREEIADIERSRWVDRVARRPVAEPDRPRVVPSAEAIDRAGVILNLMKPERFAKTLRGDPIIAVKAVWLYAMHATPARIKRILGVPKSTLYAQRAAICASITYALAPDFRDKIATYRGHQRKVA